VVTSQDPALTEVGGDAVRSAPTGDAVALGHVLREVVEDGGARAGMAAAGRRRAASFTWDGVAARLEELYRTL
jgi:glycosyltransferase involved in cell wall biosynthesis